MFAGQLEFEIVFEIFSEAVHAIVAGKAIVAVFEDMADREGRVCLEVAGFAGVGGEGGDVPVMAVVASERLLGGCALMSTQGEAYYFMRELGSGHDGELGVRAAVLGVAIAAGKGRVVVEHTAVYGCDIL